MTIEKLLQCSADQWEKFTEEELLKYFEPVLHITRPDLVTKERAITTPRNTNNTLDSKMEMARKIAAQFGLDLDAL